MRHRVTFVSALVLAKGILESGRPPQMVSHKVVGQDGVVVDAVLLHIKGDAEHQHPVDRFI